MRSYHLESFGSVDGITVREHDEPAPGRHEVLVRMKSGISEPQGSLHMLTTISQAVNSLVRSSVGECKVC